MLLSGVERAIEDLQMKRADLDRTLKELKDIRAQCVEHLKKKGSGSGRAANKCDELACAAACAALQPTSREASP